jgi:hypothetical protein
MAEGEGVREIEPGTPAKWLIAILHVRNRTDAF